MKAPRTNGLALTLLACTLASCTTPETAPGPAGTPLVRINPIQIHRQTIVSDEEIRFEMRNGEVWANKLKNKCFGLKFEEGFSWEVSGNTVCSNQQIIRVLNTGTSCVLGEFTKLPAAPA